MRKQIAIIGRSEEGLALIPLLETNPDVEVCAILVDDPEAAHQALARLDAELAERFAARITSDGREIAGRRLAALIDADAPAEHQELLSEAPGHGVQVTTPLIAKLLYAFGPVDATRKPDLLNALAEVLESYNLTVDKRGLLSRILQIAVGSTGADRGSLMLLDEESSELRVEVAIGIERELISKIRVRPGEGVAGRAFADRQALLLHGKADHQRYDIVREREDVESAISAPLMHDDRVLGVLNLSHARQRGAFSQEDLEFVEQLARIDAKIIVRAQEYHTLRRDSVELKTASEVREALARSEPLTLRLSAVCRMVARELDGGICHVYVHDADLDLLTMSASSTRVDPLSSPVRVRGAEGLLGWVARTRRAVRLSDRVDGACACFAAFPLVSGDELLAVLALEGALTGQVPELLYERIQTIAGTLAEELGEIMRRDRAQREATRMAAITEASSTLAACEDAGELQRAITTSAAMILESEHAILRVQDAETGRFQIQSYFGALEHEAQRPLFELDKEVSKAAIQGRAGVRRVDVAEDPVLGRLGADVQSVLVEPLLRSGRAVGTLCVLGKMARDPMLGDCFDVDDQRALQRLAGGAQRALERLQEREATRHNRRFDELTGLPNAAYLRERLDQEVARVAESGRTLALVRFRVAGLAEALLRQQEGEVDRLVLALATEIREELRGFDVLSRSAPDVFEVLLPEPSDDVASLIGPLARRTRETLRQEPWAGSFDSLSLEFGYAEFPTDARTARQLVERSAETRVTSG